MPAEELPVAVPVVAAEAARGPVVDLKQLFHVKEQQSAGGAPPLLLLEQGGLARRQFGGRPSRVAQYSRSPS
jgi:hypothetical protein